jgi:hypothetical protein
MKNPVSEQIQARKVKAWLGFVISLGGPTESGFAFVSLILCIAVTGLFEPACIFSGTITRTSHQQPS